MVELPQEELPPHIRIVFPVAFGLKDGNGSPSWQNRPLAAVEIDSGSTAALASGNESGMTDQNFTTGAIELIRRIGSLSSEKAITVTKKN
jgi:hypothetical protein